MEVYIRVRAIITSDYLRVKTGNGAGVVTMQTLVKSSHGNLLTSSRKGETSGT